MHEVFNGIPTNNLLFSLGGVLALLWSVVFLLATIWRFAWAWMDDATPRSINFLHEKIIRWRGWRPREEVSPGGAWRYYKNFSAQPQKYDDITDSVDNIIASIHVIVITTLIVGPITVFYAWQFLLAAAVLYATALLARYSRRHKKLFDEHLKDQNAHKN
jgi:hypothetical protein